MILFLLFCYKSGNREGGFLGIEEDTFIFIFF